MNTNLYRYINRMWGLDTSESYDDTNLFWNRGYLELVVKRLVNAGAVEDTCPEAHEMIRIAENMTSSEEQLLIEQCMSESPVSIHECPHCGHAHFLDSRYDSSYSGVCQSCNRSSPEDND